MAATAPPSTSADFAQAGELKIGQVGIANLRIRVLDVARLATEMAERVQGAPKLFERAAVILDFGGLSACPAADEVRALVDALRRAGVLPAGIAYGTREVDALAREVGLPLLAKFRASYERAEPAAAAPVEAPAPAPVAEAPRVVAPPRGEPGLVQTQPVRSGQQVYAQQRDLTVCATVGAGAEVIADGSIHIYGALRGRALAGAGGFEGARIFCREFQAELVAIAGTYKVLEDIPAALRGKPVQVRLDNGQLRIEELA
jgi:septum site-determining protein MinC